MVEVLRSPSLGQTMPNAPDMMEMTGRFMNTSIGSIQEEETGYAATKEGGFKNGNANGSTNGNSGNGNGNGNGNASGNGLGNSTSRAPRRAFTSADYQLPASSASLALQAQRRLFTPSASTPRESSEAVAAENSFLQVPRQIGAVASSPASPRHATPVPPSAAAYAAAGKGHAQPPRSYSLMDVEPVPFTHQPGAVLTLPQLPPELHYAIFDFLDPIDSTCLALTSKHFYAIHAQTCGRVPLTARREGPNDMEWVWRNAGPFVVPAGGSGSGSGAGGTGQNSLAMLSPRGQVYCRKCRTQRCELHMHIREWMGAGREYCEVTQRFGRAAPQGAKGFCYRSSPRHPHRCGRHTRQQRAVRLV